MSRRDFDPFAMLVPNKSEVVDISSTDHVFSQPLPTHIRVGTGGTVIARLERDSAARTFTNVADGETLLGRFRSVTRTSTTASEMIALWYDESRS